MGRPVVDTVDFENRDLRPPLNPLVGDVSYDPKVSGLRDRDEDGDGKCDGLKGGERYVWVGKGRLERLYQLRSRAHGAHSPPPSCPVTTVLPHAAPDLSHSGVKGQDHPSSRRDSRGRS